MENASKSDSTLPLLIADSVRQYGNRPAMGMAFEPPITYQEFWTSINRLALLLKDMGVKKGERVAILGENSPNWAIAYLAIVRVGAVTVPILPDLPESDAWVRRFDTSQRDAIAVTPGMQVAANAVVVFSQEKRG